MRTNPIMRFIALSIVVFSFTVACSGMVRKGDKPSEDWSRSVVIGDDAVGSLGMAVSESGERIHLIWPYKDKTGRKLRFVQLDEYASITTAKDLVYAGFVKSPQLVTAGSSNLHLFWITRQVDAPNWELWYQLLTLDGHPTGQPKMLTERGANIGRFQVYSDGHNGAIVVWDLGSNKGLKALRLGSDGDLIKGPHSIATSGSKPTFRVDPEGRVHTAWLDNRRFFYSEFRVDDLLASEPVEVVNLSDWGTLNTLGDTLQGPSLGYSDGWIYLFWSVTSLTDTEAGTGVAEYAAFPKGSPSYLQPARIWAIPAEDQPYLEIQNSLALNKLSPPMHIADAVEEYGVHVQFDNPIAGDWVQVFGAASSYILSPATMIGQQSDLAAALAVSQDRGNDTHLQIATMVFSKGQYLGYNFAGKTSYMSNDPILATDQSGNLFTAWREGASGETIYFATTTEEAKSSLDRLDVGDLIFAAPQFLIDALSSILLVPFTAFCWVIPGLILLGIWQLTRHEDSLTKIKNWFPLGIALLLYYVMKLTFLPTFTAYIPLSAWFYIPKPIEEPLRIGFPLLIFATAAFMATRLRRRFGNSMFIFFLGWVAMDGLLTLIFYGVNLMGIF